MRINQGLSCREECMPQQCAHTQSACLQFGTSYIDLCVEEDRNVSAETLSYNSYYTIATILNTMARRVTRYLHNHAITCQFGHVMLLTAMLVGK